MVNLYFLFSRNVILTWESMLREGCFLGCLFVCLLGCFFVCYGVSFKVILKVHSVIHSHLPIFLRFEIFTSTEAFRYIMFGQIAVYVDIIITNIVSCVCAVVRYRKSVHNSNATSEWTENLEIRFLSTILLTYVIKISC